MFVCFTHKNTVIVVALANSQATTQALSHYTDTHTHIQSGMGSKIGKNAMRTFMCQYKDRQITCQLLLEAKQIKLG